MLAQAQEGLSCFLVPRLIGEGEQWLSLPAPLGQARQPLQRSEVEFAGAIGEMVGEPGGVKTIMDMVTRPARLRGGFVGADAGGTAEAGITPATARCSTVRSSSR